MTARDALLSIIRGVLREWGVPDDDGLAEAIADAIIAHGWPGGLG